MNLIDSIHQAAKQKMWGVCMHYTTEALKEGKVVKWEITQGASLDYAEWQAGEPMGWRASTNARVVWSVWSLPSPARKVGNSWTGGAMTLIDQGSRITVTPDQAARFIEAINTMQP